jgi:hypothetical protein
MDSLDLLMDVLKLPEGMLRICHADSTKDFYAGEELVKLRIRVLSPKGMVELFIIRTQARKESISVEDMGSIYALKKYVEDAIPPMKETSLDFVETKNEL